MVLRTWLTGLVLPSPRIHFPPHPRIPELNYLLDGDVFFIHRHDAFSIFPEELTSTVHFCLTGSCSCKEMKTEFYLNKI